MTLFPESKSVRDQLLDHCRATGLNVESPQSSDEVKWFYLLCIMDDCVSQSGFPYLFRYLNGNYLADLENALVAVGAVQSQQNYVAAAKAALSDESGYVGYMEGGPNPGTHFYDTAVEASMRQLMEIGSVHDEVPAEMERLRREGLAFIEESG